MPSITIRPGRSQYGAHCKANCLSWIFFFLPPPLSRFPSTSTHNICWPILQKKTHGGDGRCWGEFTSHIGEKEFGFALHCRLKFMHCKFIWRSFRYQHVCDYLQGRKWRGRRVYLVHWRLAGKICMWEAPTEVSFHTRGQILSFKFYFQLSHERSVRFRKWCRTGINENKWSRNPPILLYILLNCKNNLHLVAIWSKFGVHCTAFLYPTANIQHNDSWWSPLPY